MAKQQPISDKNKVESIYPEIYNFPPFFTIQPVLVTREKQLALWCDIVVKYCTIKKIKVLSIYDKELWVNPTIQRSLSIDAIQTICNYMIQNGYGEWQDTDIDATTSTTTPTANKQTNLRVFWYQPEQLSNDIYKWAEQSGYIGITNSIVTLYELHSGEDTIDMSFHGMDEDIIRRALLILEQNGKCTIFQGDTSDEDGIKFS